METVLEVALLFSLVYVAAFFIDVAIRKFIDGVTIADEGIVDEGPQCKTVGNIDRSTNPYWRSSPSYQDGELIELENGGIIKLMRSEHDKLGLTGTQVPSLSDLVRANDGKAIFLGETMTTWPINRDPKP